MGIGIDIGASAVKTVSVRRTLGGFRVDGAARKRLPRTAAADELRALSGRALCEALGPDGRATGVVGLTGRDVNLRVVQQPNTSALNYRQMMFYEVEQARGADGDLYADYATLREPDPYFPQFLAMVGMGKRSYVDERIALATAAGADVRDAAPNSFGLFAAWSNAHGAEGGTVMLLDIGAENMEIVFARGGRMIFARNVSNGARAFDTAIAGALGVGPEEAEAAKVESASLGPPSASPTDREERVFPAVRSAASQITGVLQSTIAYAKGQLADKELVIDKVYLSGGGARLRGLPEYLQGALKIPVEILDPFKNVDVSAMKETPEFTQLPTDFACALGLAQLSATTAGATTLSILPDPLRRRRAFFTRWFHLAAGGLVLVAALTALTVMAVSRRSREQAALDEFNARTRSVGERVEKLNGIEKAQREAAARTELLLAHARPGRGLVDLILKLRKTLPQGINVRALQFTDLSERSRDPIPRRRCLFHHPAHGLVLGELVREEKEGDSITLRPSETYKKSELVGFTEWDSPSIGIAVDGEVDENIPGGAGHALVAVKEQLNDPSRGVSAEIESTEHSKEKPGWRNFRIVVRVE